MAGATKLLAEISFSATASTLTETTTFEGSTTGGFKNVLFMLDVTGVTGTHSVNLQYQPASAAFSVAKELTSISTTGMKIIPLASTLSATTDGQRIAIPHPTNVLVTSATAGDVLVADLYMITGD